MASDSKRPDNQPPLPPHERLNSPRPEGAGPNEEKKLGDFVRRFLSAGAGVAGRSKDDFLRVATGEIRQWLDHMELDKEIVKALSKMSVQIKAEVSFKQNEDGVLKPETKTDFAIKVPRANAESEGEGDHVPPLAVPAKRSDDKDR